MPIFQDIELTADYHTPATYRQLLTQFGSYDRYRVDVENSDFIPVTSVTNHKDRIPFIIGLLAPSTKVSGRLLDRSASVANVDQGAISNSNEVQSDTSSGDWQGKGSKQGNKVAKDEAKTAGTPLNATESGKAFQAAQAAYGKALQAALDAMAKVPPLKMLVNPAEFTVKGEKIVQDGNWGRNGPIVEHWGDGQDVISASGKLAAFMALDARNGNGPGLTRAARNFSASWQNFQSLYQIYRCNGKVMLPDPMTSGLHINIAMVGNVYIYYDSTLYFGSFNNLNVTETEASPFTAEYNFEFTVRAAFLLDRTDDAFTYGASSFFGGQNILTNQKAADLFNTPE